MPQADAPVADLRERLAIALDVDDLVAALRTARNLRPWFGVAKVGLELFIASGAEAAGLPPPIALAITVLTSDGDAPPHILGQRVAAAAEAGCDGIVCAASDVREAKELMPKLLAVVPGIRPADADAHDQARSATPQEALEAGADMLVVGRAVTSADDPATAAAALAD